MKKEKVLIIGGGFAGSYLSKILESKVNVTLIDAKDYFEFTPSILKTIVSPKHIKKIQVLHTHYLHKAQIIVSEVMDIKENYVILKNEQKVEFDTLVVCSGSRYELPIKEKNLIIASRASHLRASHRDLVEAENITIVGGGLVGVELAGEINRVFPSKKIKIIQRGSKLLHRLPKKARDYAKKKLKAEILLNEEVKSVKDNIIVTNKQTFPTDLVFLCTGIKTNHEFLIESFKDSLNKRNAIKVNEFLQVKNHDNIYAAGDITDIKEEKTAQAAEIQARVIANNILGIKTKYISKTLPMIVSIGNKGILIQNNMVITGIIPGLMKKFVELKTMRKYL